VLLLAFTCVGLILQLRAVKRGVYPAVLLMNALTETLTWSVGGRSLVPVLPVVYICVAVTARALLVSDSQPEDGE
jgi:hypothetical protein